LFIGKIYRKASYLKYISVIILSRFSLVTC